MAVDIEGLTRLALKNGCRSSAVFEQLANYIQMGKYSYCPAVDIPAIGQKFIAGGCTQPSNIEQVRTLLDRTIRIDVDGPDENNVGYFIKNNQMPDNMPQSVVSILGVNNPAMLVMNGGVSDWYVVNDPSVVSIIIPNVPVVNDLYYSQNINLVTVQFPQLTNAKNAVFYKNPSLSSIQLGDITSHAVAIDDTFLFDDNDGIASLDASAIQSASNVCITNNRNLTTLDLSGLTKMNGAYYTPTITFKNNRLWIIRLPAFNISPLESGFDIVTNIYVSNEQNLALLEADVMTDCGIIDVQNTTVTNILFPELITSGPQTYIDNPTLVTLNLNKLAQVYLGNLMIKGSPFLALVNLPKLVSIYNGWLWVEDNTTAVIIFCPLCELCAYLLIRNNAGLIGIVFPLVTFIEDAVVTNNNALVAINFPALHYLGSMTLADNDSIVYFQSATLDFLRYHLSVDNCALLATISLPAMREIGRTSGADVPGTRFLYINNCPTLLNVDFSGLVADATISTLMQVNNCPNLTHMHLGAWIPRNTTCFDMRSCNWTSAFINDILARCVANPGFVSGTIDFRSNPNGPSGQGVVDWQTLSARGVDVKII